MDLSPLTEPKLLLLIATLGTGLSAALAQNPDTSGWLIFGAIIFGIAFLSEL